MLSKFSVKKPVTIIIIMLIVLMLGTYSVIDLKTDLMPSMELPYAVVFTTYYGNSPETVEGFVSRPLESSMATLQGIKNITSTSQEHVSMIMLEFEQSTNMDSALIEMREKLDMVIPMMPDGVGAPMILKIDPAMMPVMGFSVSLENKTSTEVSSFINNIFIPEIEKVSGVATISATGLSENQIHISLDESKLEQVNMELMQAMMALQMQGVSENTGEVTEMEAIITADMIKGIIAAQNFSMPSGYISDSDKDYLVRVGDAFESIEELNSLPIFVMGPKVILLSDVAQVNMIDVSDDTYSKVNGENAANLMIQKQSSAVTTEVSDDIKQTIEEMQDKYPELKVTILLDQAEYINMSLNTVYQNLLIGALLAILVLWLFLKNIRPTFIVALSIPLSLLATFILMYFMDVTLNILSMGGLALAVGMIVDNSIVVIENIYRYKNEGKEIKQACIDGAKQVSGAIVSSTITTICVFLPILFVGGFVGDIFRDMSLTITFSLLSSLFIALTLVPAIGSKILSKEIDKKEHKGLEFVKNKYEKVLVYSLKHKTIVIILVVLMFFGSIYGATLAGTEFFPTTDEGQLSISVQMEKGADFEATIEMADNLTEALLTHPDVDTVSATAGGSGIFGMISGSSSGGSASITVILKDDREKDTVVVAEELREIASAFDCEVSIESESTMSSSMLTGSGLEVEISGNDFEVMEVIAIDVAKIMSEIDGIVEIDNGISKTAPELKITVDRNKSIENGVTTAQIFMAINDVISNDTKVSSLKTANAEYEIHVIDSTEENADNLDIDKIKNYTIQTMTGEVKISDVATVEIEKGVGVISRYNQKRVMTVSGAITEGMNSGKTGDILEAKLAEYEVVEGYGIRVVGAVEQLNSALNDVIIAMLMAIMLIYLIMAAQFQSFRYPFIVLFSIPLAFTGGFIALIITGLPLSMVAMIGFIILFGVVVNNGIVLVDYINKLKENGKSTYDAIVKAGRTRLRPIVMTALTTILALSTMAIGLGESAEMMQPMAITAIGGLIFATAMTLIVIPVMYYSMGKKNEQI